MKAILNWVKCYLIALKNLWKLVSMDKGLKDYYKFKQVIIKRVDDNYDELDNKINSFDECYDSFTKQLEEDIKVNQISIVNNYEELKSLKEQHNKLGLYVTKVEKLITNVIELEQDKRIDLSN